ncbi:hypothetical protein Tco_0919036 [Tanacetum coccineum]
MLADLTFNSLLVSVQDIKQILRNPTLLLLREFPDSDYAGCNMDRKSTSGASQLLGAKLVCWSVKKQQYVAMSSAKAEYVVAAGCCANILWMKSQLNDYDIIYERVLIFCDNTSAIAISNNPVMYSRTKHIDIRYHFIRDHVLKRDIELWNGYLRKRRKTKPKRQNRTRNGKAGKDKVKVQAQA